MIYFYCFIGILIPFLGTVVGSFFVFFLKGKMGFKCNKAMLGFASGVMLAASIWSLIIPSIESVNDNYFFKWIPAVVGLMLGVIFLIFVNNYFKRKYKDNSLLMFSVTLHNIPEGMAVGVCFAGVLMGNVEVSLFSSFLLAIGIAIQNIPEGSIISMPLLLDGKSKLYAFSKGVLSGIVEPIASFITIVLLNYIVPVLPYLLSFAAGTMIYVVVEELIPDMHNDKNDFCGIVSLILGFCLMMVLDVSFS